jgi:hypothetical protein
MPISRQAKNGFLSNTTQMMVLSQSILLSTQKKAELSKSEALAANTAATCALNIILGTFVQAFLENLEESNIELAATIPTIIANQN